MNDAGQFYTNRVLKEWKEKDKRHAEWCRAWVQLLSDLQAYVKQHHTTGLVWSGEIDLLLTDFKRVGPHLNYLIFYFLYLENQQQIT